MKNLQKEIEQIPKFELPDDIFNWRDPTDDKIGCIKDTLKSLNKVSYDEIIGDEDKKEGFLPNFMTVLKLHYAKVTNARLEEKDLLSFKYRYMSNSDFTNQFKERFLINLQIFQNDQEENRCLNEIIFSIDENGLTMFDFSGIQNYWLDLKTKVE